jgi:hypothetical protein
MTAKKGEAIAYELARGGPSLQSQLRGDGCPKPLLGGVQGVDAMGSVLSLKLTR